MILMLVLTGCVLAGGKGNNTKGGNGGSAQKHGQTSYTETHIESKAQIIDKI